jgi:hypothetical protein
MSFAILGAAAGGVIIKDPACVSKTYPRFFEDLAAVYAAAGVASPLGLRLSEAIIEDREDRL